MKKFLALLAAAALMLSLAACAPKGEETDSTATDTPAPSESAAPALSDVPDWLFPDNEADLAQEFLGFPNSTVLLTVNGAEVTAEEYLYWLGNITAYYDSLYMAYGLTLDMEEEVSEGVTWDQQFKDAALQNAVLLAIAPQLAEEYGVSVTEEDLAEMAQDHADQITENGADLYAYQLQAMNINDRTAYKMDMTSRLYTHVREAMAKKTAGEVTPDEVADYVEAKDILRAKHILLLTMNMSTREPYDDETVAAQRAKAEDILAQLKNGADFDALMNQYSEDGGLATNPDGYTFTAGDMVSEFEEGTRALEYGQMSDELVESYYGYHIILRLDPDSPELREEVADSQVNNKLQGAVDVAKVEKAPEYDTFSTADYYTKILAYQEAHPMPGSEGSSDSN